MMISKIKKLLLCAGAALMAASCMIDDHSENEPSGKPGMVRFTLAVPGHSTLKPSSRALTEAQESAISNVYVLAFSTTGANSGKLAYLKKGKSVSGTTFEIDLPLGTYDLMVVGNAESEVTGAALAPGTTTKAQAITMLKFTRTGKWDYTKPIPVWGHTLSSVTVNDGSPSASPIDIDMHRMVARIDVTLSAAAAGTGNANFALTEVYLANFNTVGQIAPTLSNLAVGADAINPGKQQATAPSVPSAPGKQAGMAAASPWAPAQVYKAADDLTASKVERTIYTFEAENGTSTSHSTNPCLVIGGKYKGSGSPTTYYRVDFANNNGTAAAPVYDYLDLLRNHRYTVTINEVTGAGYETPKEAFDARSFNIEVEVLKWEESDMEEAGFDGQYTLAISRNSYEFEYDGGPQPLTIRTDYPGGWNAKVCNAAGVELTGAAKWLTLSSSSGAVGTRDINLSVPNYTNTTADRTVYVHITAGRMLLKIEVTQTKFIPVPLAAPGVIGYIRGTNTLTIRGSKEYSGTPVAPGGIGLATGMPVEDQTVYVAYFKWGSLVALGSHGGYGDEFDRNDVIAGPTESGYDLDNLKDNIIGAKTGAAAWGTDGAKTVPYRHGTDAFANGWKADYARGLGDPCDYWFGDRNGTSWRLPTGNSWYNEGGSPFGSTHTGNWANNAPSGTKWVNNTVSPYTSIPASGAVSGNGSGGQNWSMFLPAAGYRTPDGTANQYAYGHYWSSTAQSIEIGYNLRFSSSLVEPSSTFSNHSDAFTVRCVRPAEPPLAAPGMIGYIKGTNELTLKGSKEYASHAGIKAYADATFGGLSDKTVYVAYFQFGSLVALSSDPSDHFLNAGGTYLEPEDILAGPWEWPGFSALKNAPTWGSIPKFVAADYNAGIRNTSAANYHNAANIALGKGDPCMYYFGKRHGNGWRLPTGNPYHGATAYTTGTLVWKNAGELGAGIPRGRLSSRSGESGWFYPITGYRISSHGQSNFQGANTWADQRLRGYYMTSYAYNNYVNSLAMIFSDTDVAFSVAATLPHDGIAVRCVR